MIRARLSLFFYGMAVLFTALAASKLLTDGATVTFFLHAIAGALCLASALLWERADRKARR